MDRRTSFAIVGAGPAGLSAAMALKEHGFNNITVLEREAVVGGKCHSYLHEDRAYDLGANLTTPRYDSIRPLADRLGMTQKVVADRRIVNVGTEQFASLTDAGFVERAVIQLGAQLYYFMRWLSGVDRQGYADLPNSVKQPFSQWLRNRLLGRFIELFEVLFVAYGYGQVMELPAAYALKFFDRIHLSAAIETVLGKEVPFTTEFVEGFQELWDRVVLDFKIAVVTSAQLTTIRRSAKGVVIQYSKDGSYYTKRFDKLILACPLQAVPAALDISTEEQALFELVQTNEYYVTIAQVQGMPAVSTYVYPYARKLTPGQPTVFYPPANRLNDTIFTFYAYGGPGVDEQLVRANITTTIQQLGGQVLGFLHTQKWNYFPHVSCDTMHDLGFYERLDDLQGVQHTYYVGEALAFTLVELIRDHAYDLVERRIA